METFCFGVMVAKMDELVMEENKVKREEVFVFAVCGTAEHIDTLAFSLTKLKKVTSKRIIVVTDVSRNEKEIIHEEIVHIETPEKFNNHQASIFLKTGLNKFLPKGNLYCYLDSDVVAISKECDKIFENYITPIRFAPDHCKIPLFSPSAVNCNCTNDIQQLNKQLNEALDKEDPFRLETNEKILELRKSLEAQYWLIRNNWIAFIWVGLRYLFSFKTFQLNEDLIYDKKTKIWSDSTGVKFMRTPNMKRVTKKLGLKWSWIRPIPRLPDGRSIWRLECNHLVEEIQNKFGVKVKNKNWQHWNGGVFLFDNASHEFLNHWHDKTMEIFNDEKWKTRDQGALIATVWELGLEKQPLLDKKWNLLADFYNPEVRWEEGWNVRMSKSEKVKPVFAHVYHHFFDKNWLLWRKIEEL